MDDTKVKNITHYLFADLILDVQRGELYREGQVISLPKLSYDLLVTLVESSPSLLSQAELMQKVWPSVVISDETLKQRVKILRKSLGDNASDPTYIEAVRGRGYRLLPVVKCERIISPSPEVKIELAQNNSMADLAAHVIGYAQRTGTKFKLIAVTVFTLVVAIGLWLNFNESIVALPNTEPTIKDLSEKGRQQKLAKELFEKGQNYYKRYRKLDNVIAIDFYLQAIEIDPKFSLAYARLSQAYSQQIFQFEGLEKNKNLAIDNAYQALLYDNQSAESYKALGTAYYVSSWYSKSADAYAKALQLVPENIDALTSLGFIYFEQGKLTQALERIRQALILAPSHVGSMVHAGQILQSLGQYELAKKWYRKAIANQPDYIRATYHLGQLHIELGQYPQAKVLFEGALIIYPSHPLLLEGLADHYLFIGQPERALPLYNEVRQSLPLNDLSRAGVKSVLLSKKTKDEEVLALIERYNTELKTGSESASYSYHLSMLYAHLKQKELSLRYLIQATELGFMLQYKLENNVLFSSIRETAEYREIIANLKLKQKIHAKELGARIIF
jgi:tetratricopeptide (TPR) repeat protein